MKRSIIGAVLYLRGREGLLKVVQESNSASWIYTCSKNKNYTLTLKYAKTIDDFNLRTGREGLEATRRTTAKRRRERRGPASNRPPPAPPRAGGRGLSRRPARSTRNFSAEREPRASRFRSLGKELSEMPACRPTPPPGPHGGLHQRPARRPHAAALTMCGCPGGQTQGARGTGRTRGGGRARRGMARLGQGGPLGQAHHGSEELGTHATPSQLAPGTRGKRSRK